ncbi:MAG TPA: ABC transporter permease [Thermoanaerobaculia bacterium]
MNTALVIASRELRERSRLLLFCAAFALLPFIAALLPAARADRATTMALVGALVSASIATGTSLALGSSVIGRELAERRLSFYFARPVSPAALWFGKAGASLLVSLLAFAIAVLPVWLVTRGAAGDLWRTLPLVAGGSIVVLFFVSHAGATMVRSRSMLLALDFVLAVLAAGALFLIVRPIFAGGGVRIAATLVNVTGLAILAVLMIAPVWQLANGRTDIRRNHLALSRALWPAVAVVLLAAGAFGWWVVSPDPADLRVHALQQAPDGTHLFISGSAASRGDYQASYIVDAASGARRRLDGPPWWSTAFSRDGKVMAWLQPASLIPGQVLELHTMRLDGGADVATGIVTQTGSAVVLSDDGTRAAVASWQNVSVHDLAARRILAVAPALERRQAVAMYFRTPDVLRIYESSAFRGAGPLRISELDLRTKHVTVLGQTNVADANSLAVSDDGSRLLLRRTGLLLDGRTGAQIAALPHGEARAYWSMLADGTSVSAQRAGGAMHVRAFDASGAPRADVVLPGVRSALVSGSLGDGRVYVAGNRGERGSRDGRVTFVVDLNRGAVVHTAERVRAGLTGTPGGDPRIEPHRPGSALAAFDADGRVVLWDPDSGATKRLQ